LVPNTFPKAYLWYLLAFAMAVWPYLFEGKVIAPHRQTLELAVAAAPLPSQAIENRKFNDFFTVYVPEISQHLKGNRSGWLATWSPYNELGRPLYHSWGFSPAYPPSWLLARFTHDPLLFYRTLVLTLIFAGGTFIFLLLRELRLAPAAAAAAAILFVGSPQIFYWLTFPMFISVWTWSAGIMLGLVRFANRADLAGWSTVCFAAYSLLVMGYPQQVIFHAYLLAGWAVFAACIVLRRRSVLHVARFLFFSAAAGALAIACALPILLEIATMRASSARTSVEPSFFLAVLPKVDSLEAGLRAIVSLLAPEALGNPISPGHPIDSDGRNAAPLLLFLAAASLSLVWRRVWGLWLAIAVCLLLTFNHPLYVWAVDHLGFNVSRSAPIVVILLPLTLIAAYAIDAALSNNTAVGAPRRFGIAAWPIAMLLVMLLCALALAYIHGFAVAWGPVMALILLGGASALFFVWPRPSLIVAVAALATLLTAAPLRLAQHPNEIIETSPLVEAIRRNLREGERYAFLSPTPVLPPNINATLRLATLHTYNSLSAVRYHALLARLGGQTYTYGRHNVSIAPRLNQPDFMISNIAVVLSDHPVHDPRLGEPQRAAGFWLYRINATFGCCRRFPIADGRMVDNVVEISTPETGAPVHKSKDLGDLLEMELDEGPKSLVVISQRYDNQWRAEEFRNGSWVAAKTVAVNDVFQGVVVDAGSTRLRLRYQSTVRYAWLANLVFVGLALGILAPWLLRRRSGNVTLSV
jgi:hypothetical protein